MLPVVLEFDPYQHGNREHQVLSFFTSFLFHRLKLSRYSSFLLLIAYFAAISLFSKKD
ncbi:hypothetical protein B4102_2859 [Heyndrickxia sporothermodurans]|uniref:Uncharacterized protein n=1 Tax=Heyndrickxia sporothermodurans TaxID=46224 RepID=A0A150L8I0_9BACI|nr:hypothetical protein B4102_2859 [Heyndrickxia sporothermodurans]